ncbi:MAG: hypothetical protein IKE01_02305 [Clostridia bacterium]|nr:hypothetical protein [Clostridia bacterium]
MRYEKELVNEMEKIYQLLNELQYNETKYLLEVQINQSKIIKRLKALQEYNEIDDMNNAVIDRKLNEILTRV